MRNEYPRNDFKRESFISLNKEWEFDFDDNNIGHKEKWFLSHKFNRKINVPFCFQSKLSGIEDTSFHDYMWYRLNLGKINFNESQNVILSFEGVDYYCEVYINGYLAKTHTGSMGAFKIAIEEFLNKNENNNLVVYVYDPSRDKTIPRGKQDWEKESHVVWYTRTSGIYKSVHLAIVNKKHIEEFLLTTKLDEYEISIDLKSTTDEGFIEFIVDDGNDKKQFKFEINNYKNIYKFNLPYDFVNDRIWTLKRPFLFNLTLNLYNKDDILVDSVSSYFGIREISQKNGKFLLNDKPIYQKLVLNQGYFKEGILTAPSIEMLEKDLDMMIEMGFNGCRIHQKVEDPYFLYLCDKKGFLVWEEGPSIYGYNRDNAEKLINEWIENIKNNFNHPCIVCYTPFNESWGAEDVSYDKKVQAHVMSLYYLIKSLDDTRLVISNDGWEHCKTDLITIHNYNHGEKVDIKKYKKFVKDLSTRNEILKFDCINKMILNPGFNDENQPIILSEFGGIAFEKDTNSMTWCYSTCHNEKEYISELKRIYKAIEASDCIEGICFTQFTDVEQEVNGLLTYERKFKVNPKIIKEINNTLGNNKEYK